MPPSSSLTPPAPELPLEITEEALWNVVEETAEGIEIRPASEQMLRAMIKAGLKRMANERRVRSSDIMQARANLSLFVRQMKDQARQLGHADWLGEDTTKATAKYFLAGQIKLWPFLPPPWQTG